MSRATLPRGQLTRRVPQSTARPKRPVLLSMTRPPRQIGSRPGKRKKPSASNLTQRPAQKRTWTARFLPPTDRFVDQRKAACGPLFLLGQRLFATACAKTHTSFLNNHCQSTSESTHGACLSDLLKLLLRNADGRSHVCKKNYRLAVRAGHRHCRRHRG